MAYLSTCKMTFQSTPPHGGRLQPNLLAQPLHLFQSTPPHGGRRFYGEWLVPHTLFQSTPPHGGRLRVVQGQEEKGVVSIHAPAWGATTVRLPRAAVDRMFQSTPPHGGRHKGNRWSMLFNTFQSTPPHGGRPPMDDGLFGSLVVSIHAPAWGAT